MRHVGLSHTGYQSEFVIMTEVKINDVMVRCTPGAPKENIVVIDNGSN